MAAIIWLNFSEPKHGHIPSKSQANITKLCSKLRKKERKKTTA
jgi:hypothetical protein